MPVYDATSISLIHYDHKQDLLPLIQANCGYSHGLGEGTNLTYDLEALQIQIEDRFVSGKPRIQPQVSI